MTTEIHLDDYPLSTGTHKGAASLTLNDPGADFKSCGVATGVLVKNTTDGSSGLTVTVGEDTVLCTLAGGSLNTFTSGDTYEIYITTTEDSEISRFHTDRRFGTKVFKPSELNTYGHLHEDEDLDVDGRDVFGPGQPERARTK